MSSFKYSEAFGGKKSLFRKIDQLSGMTWVYNIWLELYSSIIYDCWARTGLIVVRSSSSNDAENSVVREEQQIISYIRSNLPVQQKIV